MILIKMLSLINWLFGSIWAIGIVYIIFAPRDQTDAAGQGQLSALLILSIIALGLLVWLNWMPHTWTKIVAFVIGMIMMLIVWNIVKGGLQ